MMCGYAKAGRGKRLMRIFLEKGWLEEAAFIGLLYQTPIRARDVVRLKKSEIDGRKVHAIEGKFCGNYLDRSGNPYQITRQLKNLISSIHHKESDMIFTKKMETYLYQCRKYDRTLRLRQLPIT